MFLEDCLILENKHIAGQNYLMRLKSEKADRNRQYSQTYDG